MKNSVFTLNEKLLGNATTAYKTVPMNVINEAVADLTTEMTTLNPEFEGINPSELSKKETIEWYQKTAAEYRVLVEKANTPEEKPAEEEKVVKTKISKKAEKKTNAPAKKEKKEKVELKKTHAEDGAARHAKYSKELSERQIELETLKSAKEPNKEAIKKVTKRIASLGRKLKRAQIAMGQSIAPDTTPSEEK